MSEVDYGMRAQQAAEKHLGECMEALYAEEAGDGGPDSWPDSPASAPFCGCDTCVVREVLWAAWSILEEAAAADD